MLLRIASAHLIEYPGEVHARATAREEQIVVELVLLRCRTLKRRALDREYDRTVPWG